MQAAWLTQKGTRNSENQDSVFLDPQIGLFVVADGLGGHRGGAIASSIAVNTISAVYRSDPVQYEDSFTLESKVMQSLVAANAAIRNVALEKQGIDNMASTVVMAALQGKNAIITNVGDSRAYAVMGNHLTKASHDHSAVAELIDNHLLPADQDRAHPFRNFVTRSLGVSSMVEPFIFRTPVAGLSSLLLCTDGLWSVLSDAEIERILLSVESVSTRCFRLVKTAVAHGAADDVTCILVDLTS